MTGPPRHSQEEAKGNHGGDVRIGIETWDGEQDEKRQKLGRRKN